MSDVRCVLCREYHDGACQNEYEPPANKPGTVACVISESDEGYATILAGELVDDVMNAPNGLTREFIQWVVAGAIVRGIGHARTDCKGILQRCADEAMVRTGEWYVSGQPIRRGDFGGRVIKAFDLEVRDAG